MTIRVVVESEPTFTRGYKYEWDADADCAELAHTNETAKISEAKLRRKAGLVKLLNAKNPNKILRLELKQFATLLRDAERLGVRPDICHSARSMECTFEWASAQNIGISLP